MSCVINPFKRKLDDAFGYDMSYTQFKREKKLDTDIQETINELYTLRKENEFLKEEIKKLKMMLVSTQKLLQTDYSSSYIS